MATNLKKTNPKLYRARALRQAYRKLGLDVAVETVLFKMFDSCICVYCGKEIAPLDFSIDHKTPKERGGTNESSNLQLICKKCNMVKGGLDDGEMKQLMAFLKTNMVIYENLYKRLRMSGLVFTLMRKKKMV